MESPQLSDQLPHTFACGLVFEGFDPQCGSCGRSVADPDLRGTIIELDDPNHVLVVAKGYCRHCEGIVSFCFRLRAGDDLHVERLADRPPEGGLPT